MKRRSSYVPAHPVAAIRIDLFNQAMANINNPELERKAQS